MQQENKEECHCSRTSRWHTIDTTYQNHSVDRCWSAPQTPDSGPLAKTIDKVLETCDEKTRIDLFSVFMKHVAMNPKNVVTPDTGSEL